MRARTCVDDDVDDVHALGEGVSQVDVVESHYGAFTLRPLQSLLAFHSLLSPPLILVKLGEIVHNDGNGQCNYQYTANRAS